MRPEKVIYQGWEDQPTTAVALRSTMPLMEDVYVLLQNTEGGADAKMTIRVFVNPLVTFIWLGGVLFLMGTVLCAWPQPQRRERTARAPARAREATPSEA